MAFMVKKLIASSKTDVRYSKLDTSDNKAKVVRNAPLLEALAKGGSVTSYIAEDGHVKIKILVKKQDLEQMLKSMDNDNTCCNLSKILPGASSSLSSSWSSSIESRLYDLMKRKTAAQAKERRTSNWKPTLLSISEEN